MRVCLLYVCQILFTMKCYVVLFCRFWDFDRDENYTVDVTRVSQVTSGEAVACVHADTDRGTVQQAATPSPTAV